MDIYERYGRKCEQLELEIERHLKSIALLRAIKAGQVDLDRVTVGEDGWSLAAASDLDTAAGEDGPLPIITRHVRKAQHASPSA